MYGSYTQPHSPVLKHSQAPITITASFGMVNKKPGIHDGSMILRSKSCCLSTVFSNMELHWLLSQQDPQKSQDATSESCPSETRPFCLSLLGEHLAAMLWGHSVTCMERNPTTSSSHLREPSWKWIPRAPTKPLMPAAGSCFDRSYQHDPKPKSLS